MVVTGTGPCGAGLPLAFPFFLPIIQVIRLSLSLTQIVLP